MGRVLVPKPTSLCTAHGIPGTDLAYRPTTCPAVPHPTATPEARTSRQSLQGDARQAHARAPGSAPKSIAIRPRLSTVCTGIRLDFARPMNCKTPPAQYCSYWDST
eukprot:3296733-Rhodomonas_salina.1